MRTAITMINTAVPITINILVRRSWLSATGPRVSNVDWGCEGVHPAKMPVKSVRASNPYDLVCFRFRMFTLMLKCLHDPNVLEFTRR